jgi:hypothetical protein
MQRTLLKTMMLVKYKAWKWMLLPVASLLLTFVLPHSVYLDIAVIGIHAVFIFPYTVLFLAWGRKLLVGQVAFPCSYKVRGPVFTPIQVRQIFLLLSELQKLYPVNYVTYSRKKEIDFVLKLFKTKMVDEESLVCSDLTRLRPLKLSQGFPLTNEASYSIGPFSVINVPVESYSYLEALRREQARSLSTVASHVEYLSILAGLRSKELKHFTSALHQLMRCYIDNSFDSQECLSYFDLQEIFHIYIEPMLELGDRCDLLLYVLRKMPPAQFRQYRTKETNRRKIGETE